MLNYMDYYSALNSLSSQNQNLDYASKTLLGGVADTTSAFTKLQSELSTDFSGIQTDAQTAVTKITSAFDAKATAQERLVAGLEGGALGIEAVKKAGETYAKYKGKVTEATSKEATLEEDTAEKSVSKVEAVGRVGDTEGEGSIELGKLGEIGGGEGSLPSAGFTATDAPAYTGARVPVTGNDPTGFDTASLNRGEATTKTAIAEEEEGEATAKTAVAEGAEGAEGAGEAVALEETAGEVAVAGGGGLDLAADVVAGSLALVGLGIGLYDMFDKSAEKKEKKAEEKATETANEAEAEATANYNTTLSNLDKQYGDIRSNIISNTHAGVAIGVQSLRNVYKSSNTF